MEEKYKEFTITAVYTGTKAEPERGGVKSVRTDAVEPENRNHHKITVRSSATGRQLSFNGWPHGGRMLMDEEGELIHAFCDYAMLANYGTFDFDDFCAHLGFDRDDAESGRRWKTCSAASRKFARMSGYDDYAIQEFYDELRETDTYIDEADEKAQEAIRQENEKLRAWAREDRLRHDRSNAQWEVKKCAYKDKDPEQISYKELVRRFKEHESTKPEEHLLANIVFRVNFSWSRLWQNWVYTVSSDNNAFKTEAEDKSIYGTKAFPQETARLDDWIRQPQSGDCYRSLDHCYMTQDISVQGDHIKIDGYSGTWRVIKTAWMHPPRERSCMPCFLLEQALRGDKKVYLIVNRFGVVLNNAVARGFDSMVADGWRYGSKERALTESTPEDQAKQPARVKGRHTKEKER